MRIRPTFQWLFQNDVCKFESYMPSHAVGSPRAETCAHEGVTDDAYVCQMLRTGSKVAAVLAMAYAVGHISGAHFNPAVTCGLVAAGRFEIGEAIPYIVAQLIGGAAAAGVFYVILSGAPAGKWNAFVAISNIYGGAGHFPLLSVALIETVL